MHIQESPDVASRGSDGMAKLSEEDACDIRIGLHQAAKKERLAFTACSFSYDRRTVGA